MLQVLELAHPYTTEDAIQLLHGYLRLLDRFSGLTDNGFYSDYHPRGSTSKARTEGTPLAFSLSSSTLPTSMTP